MKKIKKFLWRVGMTYWIFKCYYERNVIKAWQWTLDNDCWLHYFEDGYTPKEAMIDDMGYSI